jgi:hypothetical protein
MLSCIWFLHVVDILLVSQAGQAFGLALTSKKKKRKRSCDFGLNPLLHAGYLIYQATQAYIDQSAAKITVCCQTTRQAGVYEKAIPFQMQLQGHHQ